LTALRAHRAEWFQIKKLKASYTVSEALWDFDSGEVGPTNHTQLKFQEATHLPCRGWLCEAIERQKFATGKYKTVYVIFG